MADIDDLFDVFDGPSTTKRNRDERNDDQPENEGNLSVEDFLNDVLEDENVDNETEEVPRKKSKHDVIEDINIEDLTAGRIQVHTVETVEACLHEVALPPEIPYVPLRRSQGPPAKQYSFPLDPFQNEAILCLENDQSVLVSAHTSAGKTVVAEYAIAMSLKSKRRVIYTTPIKALSNQKYREFSEEFKDVGLITGDVTINATASCLIMTTEILRSMLYRGSDVMREVNWVIFDEIHYMRDKERGVIWEETIILLPDVVHYVFLSATIPNASQFAQWICHLHRQPCHVVYTDYRPVPLQQYIFPAGGDGLYMVVDENGNFSEQSFEQAMDALQASTGTNAGKGSSQRGRKGGVKTDGSCYKIVKMIMEKNFAPVIVFSFSKKECEAYAMQMAKLDFNNDDERKCVETVFNSAIDILSDEDKQLPQVIAVLPLLKKGIGIHHSGLLPILKETIEILFAEGLIKALFATETFAMGLNMPARTVLFTNARKFDGKDFRWVTSGEYIQMSGRAGRRGLDEKGIVILMLDEKMTPAVAKEIVKGLPDPINSAFHLTYNMILNLIRVDDINPEYMLEKSFYQFQNYAIIPDLYTKLKELKDKHDSISIQDEGNVVSYCKIVEQIASLDEEIHHFISKPEYCLQFIQPGRLVRVKDTANDFSWGVIVDLEQIKTESQSEKSAHLLKVLLCISKESADNPNKTIPRPPKEGEKGEMMVVPVSLTYIHQMSSVRIYLPKDLTVSDNRVRVQKIIGEVHQRFPQGVPLLHPIKDMGIKDNELKDLVDAKEAFEARLQQHPLRNVSEIKKLKNMYAEKASIESQIKEVKNELKTAKSVLQMEELKCRKRVLRRLKFCTPADVIEVKGKVACEISSADELLLTEMIFTGTLEELNIYQMTALLSCFVFQEKSNEMPKLTEELSGPLRIMQDIARKIARVSKESKLEMDADTYVESFRPHLMDVVYAWAKGASFGTICKMTDVFEGSVIRCLRRLEELLRQMCQASKALGNTEMENRFSEAIKCIKREIVFAASLYL